MTLFLCTCRQNSKLHAQGSELLCINSVRPQAVSLTDSYAGLVREELIF